MLLGGIAVTFTSSAPASAMFDALRDYAGKRVGNAYLTSWDEGGHTLWLVSGRVTETNRAEVIHVISEYTSQLNQIVRVP